VESPEAAAERRRHGSSFGPAAADYHRYRPRYAAEAIRWCLEPTGKDRPSVADIGAGTGILTTALHELGADVTAVEPDTQMLAQLRDQLPQVPAEYGSAELIPLPDHSVDAVLAGQALHWFDLDQALPEIARVLVPGGVLAGLWNLYDDQVSWIAELAEACGPDAGPATASSWRAGFARWSHGGRLTEGSEFFVPAEHQTFANPQQQRADDLVATYATHSWFLVRPEPERAALLARISDFLHRHPDTRDGEFTLPLVTAVVRAQLR